MKKIVAAVFLLFLIGATIWIVGFRGTSKLRVAEGAIFGTMYHIKYESPEALDAEIEATLQRVDESLSAFNPESTLSKINDGSSALTDEMLHEVLSRSLEVSRSTSGAFDVTVMPLVNVWGFGFKKGGMPTPSEVDSICKFVGFELISLKGDSLVKKDSRVMIDCGAIAKGYGVDCVARMLRKHGVRNYMIEIGGEVVTKGKNPTGEKWRIGVSKPIEGSDPLGGELQKVLELTDRAVATSGNYRNFYVKDGHKYAHTIDPRTGMPVAHSLLSATVMAPDCATADAYATAFMVMGIEEAKVLLAEHKELRVFFIYEDSEGKMREYDTISD